MVSHQLRLPRSPQDGAGEIGDFIAKHDLMLACRCKAVGAEGEGGRLPWLPPSPPLPPLLSHPPLASRHDSGLMSLDRCVPPLTAAPSRPCTVHDSRAHCI